MVDLPNIASCKERIVVSRKWEQTNELYGLPYVVRFSYEDEKVSFQMDLTAQEADIYQNACTQYEKIKAASVDLELQNHYKAQKYLSLHEHFAEQIRRYDSYRARDGMALDYTVEYCSLQIQYAPVAQRAFYNDPYFNGTLPYHEGYETLFSILIAHQAWEEATTLSQRAHKEGWKGDWGLRYRNFVEEQYRMEAGDIA